ncbi:MFS transporter [Chloroflexota bacterium]
MNKKVDKYDSTGIKSGMDGGMERTSLRERTFVSFKNPVYRLYYGGLLLQWFPMNMQMMTRSLLIYRLTGSAAILGAITFAHAIPTLLLSLYGGVIADRMQKKYIMIVGQVASAVVSLGIALSLSMGYLSVEHIGSWWILVVASMLQGIIMGLMMPSRQAMLPEIVSGEQLMNAVSLTTMGANALRLFAPALAGFLIAAFDFEAVYYVMTASFLLSGVCVAFIPTTRMTTTRVSNVLEDIKGGLHYIRHDTTILLILVFTLLIVVLSMPYMHLMAIFADDILKVGEIGLGWLMSVSGIGAIVGSTALASLPNKKRGAMLLISAVIMGVALASFSFSNSFYLSLALMVIVGLGQTGRMTLGNTLLQYYVTDEYRGRVMSIYMMEFGLASFATFTAGLLAEVVGIQWAVGGFAMVLALLSILALAFIPRLRKLD